MIFKTTKWGFSWLVIVAFFVACNDPTEIGNGFIADDDFLFTNYTDTLTVKAFLEVDDSIVTNKNTTHLLGSLDDPDFGKSSASLYFQVKMEGNNLSLSIPDGETPIYDSLVLSLDYQGNTTSTVYGDNFFTQLQQFKIYTLAEKAEYLTQEITDNDTTDAVKPYYATDELMLGDDLGNYFLNYDYLGVIELETEGEVEPQMRFKLPDFLGEQFFNDLQTNPDYFISDSTFTDYFNGFYIKPVEITNNAIAFVNMASAFTKLTLYYHYDLVDGEGNVTPVSQFTSFPVKTNAGSNNSVIFNHYEHDYTATEIETILNSTDKALDEFGYLQSMIGLNMRIQIPYLQNLGNILINRADLEFTIFDNGGDLEYLIDTIFPPPIIIAYTLEPETEAEAEANTDYDIFNVIDEVTDTSGNILRKYNVFMNYTLQNQILTGNNDKEFVVKIPGKAFAASRLKVYGPLHDEFPLKLNLYYTTIEE